LSIRVRYYSKYANRVINIERMYRINLSLYNPVGRIRFVLTGPIIDILLVRVYLDSR